MREFEQLRQTTDGRDTAEPIGDFIDGSILAADYFRDYAEALETLGLSEP